MGSRSFKRGRSYALGGWALAIEWDEGDVTLTGSVLGHGALYTTSACFVGDGDGALVFEEGECSCPVGYNCKHAAAIVMLARTVPAPVERRGACARRPGSRLRRSHQRGRSRCGR